MPPTCAFCDIAAGQSPATIVREWPDTIAILPRSGGCTPGHTLVIPRQHVSDFTVNPAIGGTTQQRAGELAAEIGGQWNYVTSCGPDATQTVFHLHGHLLPRLAGDDLVLPWTPQQKATQAKAAQDTEPADKVHVVYAREDIPNDTRSVFLAGPTPRAGDDVESWRPAAIAELAAQWTGDEPLTVLTPESRGGKRAKHYDDQVSWETAARQRADAILFWIPRDLRTLPGMTTNVEFGLDVATGRAVLGCPPDCPNPERNRYLIYVARRHGVPVRETLTDTVSAALGLIACR